jgi:hypothetical protein
MGPLTIMQWMQIASILVDAAPHIRAAFAALHPVFDELSKVAAAARARGVPVHEATRVAAEHAQNWLAANGAAAVRTAEQMDGLR